MKCHLRDFLEEDIPRLERRVWEGDAANFMSRWAPYALVGESWPEDLVRWHMIVSEGSDIGTVWVERDSSSSAACDLGILIFDPCFRGRGLGMEAISLAEQQVAVHWGVDLIRLRVRAGNTRALSCFQRSGYRISAVTGKNIDGAVTKVVHMEHRL